MLDKTVRLTQMYDWYAPLLTEKQREVFELYYHQNLSLAEIAEDFSVSRAAVYDILVRIEGQLSRYEAALGLADRFGQFAALTREAQTIGDELKSHCGPQGQARIDALTEILRTLTDVWTGERTRGEM